MGCTRSKTYPDHNLEDVTKAFRRPMNSLELHNERSMSCIRATLLCDKSGRIYKESLEIVIIFGASLIGGSVRQLMSPALGDLHKNILFPLYAKSSGQTKAMYDEHIRLHTRLNSIIFDSFGQPMKANLEVEAVALGFRILILSAERNLVHFNDRSILAPRLGITMGEYHTVTKKVAILALDIVNSTEYLQQHGPIKSYNLHLRFQSIARQLTEYNYHPLVLLYEIAGDCLLFISHNSLSEMVAITLMRFTSDLLSEAAMEGIPIRAALAFGDVLMTVMDDQVRIFGSPVTKACRLQSVVSPTQSTGIFENIVVCEDLYDQLQKEIIKLTATSNEIWKNTLNVTSQIAELKGFQEKTLYRTLNLILLRRQETNDMQLEASS